MYEFKITRWGRFQLRLVLAFLFLLLLGSSGVMIWTAPKIIQQNDEFSIILFAVFAPFALWFFLLFRRAFTSYTLAYCDDGVVYRTLWGQRCLLEWTDIDRALLRGSGSDLDSVGKYVYDGQLDLFRASRKRSRDGIRTRTTWTNRISIPLSVYSHPEHVLAQIAYTLYSHEVNQAAPSPLNSATLSAKKAVLLDEADRLARSRGSLVKEMHELAAQLNSYEQSAVYWKIQRWKYGCITVGLSFLCAPFWLFCLFDDSLAFMNWKRLTLQLPLLCGMLTLILAMYLAHAAAALDSAATNRESPPDREDGGF